MFNVYLRESGLRIETGEFGGMMDVDSVNSALQKMGNDAVNVNIGQSGIGFTVSF